VRPGVAIERRLGQKRNRVAVVVHIVNIDELMMIVGLPDA
jgi:transcription antitermination factor NusA-like protein